MLPGAGLRVAVVGCGRGAVAIAIAATFPAATVAGFDGRAHDIAVARRLAAAVGLSDRVTFEVAGNEALRGGGYDVVVLCRTSGVVAPPPPR